MPGKFKSFAEYKEDWEKRPDAIKKQIEDLDKQAEKFKMIVKQLKRQNKTALAEETEEYYNTIKKVSRPASEYKTKKEQEEWEANQEKLAGLGQFFKKNRVDLTVAVQAAEEENDWNADKKNVEKKPMEDRPHHKYEGFENFLQMLIDALCAAFNHSYPELEYEQRQQREIERERMKHERELRKKELEKEQAKEQNPEPAEAEKEKPLKKPQKTEETVKPNQNKKETAEKNSGIGEKKGAETASAQAETPHSAPKWEYNRKTKGTRQLFDANPEMLKKFIGKAAENGWNTDKDADYDFLETVFRTPGLESLVGLISYNKLPAIMPSSEKLVYTNIMEAAAQRTDYSPELKNKLLEVSQMQKTKALSTLNNEYSKTESQRKTPEEINAFLAKAKANGWEADGADKEFLTTFFQTPGLELMSKEIETKPLQKDNILFMKTKYAMIASNVTKDANARVVPPFELEKVREFFSNTYKTLNAELTRSNQTAPVQEEKREEIKQEPVKQNVNPPVQTLNHLDPNTYIINMRVVNQNYMQTDKCARWLMEDAAALLMIESFKHSEKNNQGAQPMPYNEFVAATFQLVEKPDFQDMMKKKYGDLSQPENAKKLLTEMEQTKGQSLYADYLQIGNRNKENQRRYSEVKEGFQKKQIENEAVLKPAAHTLNQ